MTVVVLLRGMCTALWRGHASPAGQLRPNTMTSPTSVITSCVLGEMRLLEVGAGVFTKPKQREQTIDLSPKITPKLDRGELSFCFYRNQEG